MFTLTHLVLFYIYIYILYYIMLCYIILYYIILCRYFSLFSKLKPNLKKCETEEIEALQVVQVAVCGMKCIDERNEALR